MGSTVVGMIVALVCNLAFLKAILGFFLGAIFFAASIVCQAVFVNKAFFSVEDAGLDADILSDFKRKVIGLAEKSIGLTVAFIGFTFPLILVDAYMGLGSDSLLIWGAMGAAAFLLIYAIVLYFLNASLLKKGTYSLSERESTIYQHNHKLLLSLVINLLRPFGARIALWKAPHSRTTTASLNIWSRMSLPIPHTMPALKNQQPFLHPKNR